MKKVWSELKCLKYLKFSAPLPLRGISPKGELIKSYMIMHTYSENYPPLGGQGGNYKVTPDFFMLKKVKEWLYKLYTSTFASI